MYLVISNCSTGYPYQRSSIFLKSRPTTTPSVPPSLMRRPAGERAPPPPPLAERSGAMSAARPAVAGPGGGAAEPEAVPVRGRGLELELGRGSSTQTSHRLLAYSDALLSIIATVMVSARPGPARPRRGMGPA